MTIPNIISLVRIALIPLFVYLLFMPAQTFRLAAAALFSVLCLTDAIDGYLARKLNAASTFGKYIDPLSDKILVITALLGLIELKAVSSIPVMIIVAREFMVSAFRLSAAAKGIVIPAELLGKWKTVFQMAAVVFLLMGWPYADALLWIAVILTVLSGIDYMARSWSKVF